MEDYSYLLSPGPVNVPDSVLKAMHHRSIHHRTSEFSSILKQLLQNMEKIFRTEKRVLPVHATGRGALEATITNLFSPGDEIASICNGRFGEMYAGIAETFGLKVHRVCTDWEKDVELETLWDLLKRNPQIKAISVCHNETSTAVENDIKSIARMAHERGAIVMVDTVSSLGGMEFRFDEWEIDVAVAASQKALMAPTGLSFVVLSEKAWDMYGKSTLPKSYFDLASIFKKVSVPDPETPGSTPVALIAALAESSRMILEEGLENVWNRHHRVSTAVKKALEAMGLDLFPVNVTKRSDTVTAFFLPTEITSDAVKHLMYEKFGIVITGGLGPYKKQVIRLGHMGNFFERDCLLLISSIEAVLCMLDERQKPGAGLGSLVESLKGGSS